MNENREIHGPEGRGNRSLANESTPVEQGQDFVTSTGTLDREEMSELSDISTGLVDAGSIESGRGRLCFQDVLRRGGKLYLIFRRGTALGRS